MLLTIIAFILVLSILVLVHEFGHFITAKLMGVKVEEFGFGFPPRVLGKKYGETVYSVNLLPIGGFVKLYGEDDAGGGKVSIKKKEASMKYNKRAFFARPVWQRAVMVAAGVVMNFILATAIISYLFTTVGVAEQTNKVLVVGVVKGAPAERAGLKNGDQIESVNGKIVKTPNDIISITRQNLGKEMSLMVKDKKGNVKNVLVTPRVNYPKDQGAMGIAISQDVIVTKYAWYKAPFYAVIEAVKECWMILVGIGMTIGQLIVTRQVPQGVAGPVGIAQLTGQFVRIGPNAVLSLISLLSLNLAVLNVLPIPALDGGRLFFILLEGLTGKKIRADWEAQAHNIGMIVLLILIALITLHDILRLISGQPLLPKM